jgi:hypothetical protein
MWPHLVAAAEPALLPQLVAVAVAVVVAKFEQPH